MRATAVDKSLELPARESLHLGEPLSVVSIGLDDETSQFVKLFAASSSLIRLRSQLAGNCADADADSLVEQLGALAPEICLLDFDAGKKGPVRLAEYIHARLPGMAIFAVSRQNRPEAILEAMRCGCSEYLVKPIDADQFTRAVIRIGGRRREQQNVKQGQLVAFMGAKGGCGVTTLVTQLGALLSKSCSRSTLLVDLHADFGDAALYLKLMKTRYHFFELLENAERLDADLLEGFVLKHSSGLDVIPAPEGSGPASNSLPLGALSSTLEFLRSRYEFIVADLPPSLNHENLTVIRDCEQLYLVTVAEVSAIRNVVRQLQYFQEREIPREKIRVVLNRDQKRNVLTQGQIEKAIEQEIFWCVPNQYPQVVKTIHEGDPVAQLANSEVTRSLQKWAAAIGKKPGTDSKKNSGGFLSLWGR